MELSRPKVRVEDWLVSTSPGSGKPVLRQCPLLRTSAGAVSREFGNRMTDPEQLLRATVPASVTAFSVGDAALAEAAVALPWSAGAGAAIAGAAPAPAITRASSAAARGFFMWGSST